MTEVSLGSTAVHESARRLDRVAKQLERYAVTLASQAYVDSSVYDHISQLIDVVRSEMVELSALKLRVVRSKLKETTDLGIGNLVVEVINQCMSVKRMCISRDRERIVDALFGLVSKIYSVVALLNLYSLPSLPTEKKEEKIIVAPPISSLAQQIYAFIASKSGGRCRYSELLMRFSNVKREELDSALNELERYGYVSRYVDPITLDFIFSL